MNAQTKELLAFHVAARTRTPSQRAAGGPELWPALLRGYRELAALRHDDPLVLVEHGSCRGVESLSALVNALLQRIAPQGPSGETLRRQVLSLERELRALTLTQPFDSLAAAWQAAAAKLAGRADLTEADRQSLSQNLERARAALEVQGPLLRCGADTAEVVLRHLWNRIQRATATRVRAQLGELKVRLAELLENDYQQSLAARSPAALAAGFGTRFDSLIDFGAMSRTLLAACPERRMPAPRRERIAWALSVLENERFFGTGDDGARYEFEFASGASALAEFRRRLPQMVDLVKAIRLSALELDNRYRPEVHETFFAGFNADALTAEDLSWFPAYFVSVTEEDGEPSSQAALLEILASDLPVKLVVPTRRLFPDPASPAGALGNTLWRTSLAAMAVNLQHAFVVQTTSASLCPLADALVQGLAAPGPALFSVFCPAEDSYPGVAPYLAAAAALESRACPALAFDPRAGSTWAECFSLAGNPQPERTWVSHPFRYEDEAMQSVSATLAFTVVDLLALDPAWAESFLPVSRDQWTDDLIPLVEYLEASDDQNRGRIPYLLMVGPDDTLRRVVVKSAALRWARRCARVWRSLQELGGIANSHALRALDRARQEWEGERAKLIEAARAAAAPSPAAPISAAAEPAAAAAEAAKAAPAAPAAPAVSRDEAYIETARCSSCNECVNRNNRMFKYNENKQGYLADVRAGTYRQLVESAEACKLAIIHPGQPWNPNEPDLEELLQRAEPFR